MATLYGSDGVTLTDGINVSLDAIEEKLRARGYDFGREGLTYIPGDNAPPFEQIAWHDRVLLRVYDSEPKTKVFSKSGWYHLRKLSSREEFLSKP